MASNRMPTARAKAMDLMVASPAGTNPAKTENMIAAAATTTGAAWRNPVPMAARAGAPWLWASCIRETRKTW